MESNSFLNSLNWSILKAMSDDDNDSDDTLIDNDELTQQTTTNIFHNGSRTKLAEQLSQVKYEETCIDSNVNDIENNNEKESYFEFFEFETTKHIKNKNERESYFGFSNMDEESNQRSSVKQNISRLDWSKEGFVGKTDVVSSTDKLNQKNSSNKYNALEDGGVSNDQILKITKYNLIKNNESNNLQVPNGHGYTNSVNEKEKVDILNEFTSDVDLIESGNKININEIESHFQIPIFTEEVPVKKLETVECGKNTNLAADDCFQSDEILEGLTENLENICKNPLDIFFENSNSIPVRKPCSPPLTLCTGTRRHILPAEKKLPKYNKKPNLTIAVKQLPVRKCASYYINKSNRKPVPEEKESSPGKREKNTYSSDKEIEISLANKFPETTQSKNVIRTNIGLLKTNKNSVKILLKPKKELKKKIKNKILSNKTFNEELMSLLEIEERLKSLEVKVTGWVNGSETTPPSREQAFQMLTDTNRLVSQLQQKLEKKHRRQLSAKVKEKRYISLLLDRSQLLAMTIDNAIVEADRLMEIENSNAETGDDGNESSQSTLTSTETIVKNCSSKKYTCLEILKPILKNSNSENSLDNSSINNKHISFSDEIEYLFLTCSDQDMKNSRETPDEAKTASGNVEIPLDNQNIAETTFNNIDIAHMANSFQSKISLSDEQLVTSSKATEVSITSTSDLPYLENHSQVLKGTLGHTNECTSVQTKTLQTSFKNLTTVSKEVQTIHTPCSDDIDGLESVINSKNQRPTMKSLENQDQQSEKEIFHSNTNHTPTTKDIFSEKGLSDITQLSIYSSETKKVNSINTSEQKVSSYIDNKQNMCNIYSEKRQFKIFENSINKLTNQINQEPLSLTNLINSRDNITCDSVSDQSSKSESSFGFSELESEDESCINISIMNVKTIRAKDQEEFIPMSNLSSDMFESDDWFEGLDEWGEN